jgi:trehalose-6-phosphatase
VYVGDDVTDEDAFASWPATASASASGPPDESTGADLHVRDPAELEHSPGSC